jgi:hypothetical protein
MTLRTFRSTPQFPTGYPQRARWRVVMPPTTTTVNIVSNPSIETGTTGYTAIGGTVAQSISKQRRGAYSLLVTPGVGVNDGFYFGTVSVTAKPYPWLFDFWGEAGRRYKAYWATTGAAQLGPAVSFVGLGRWDRIKVPNNETATVSRRLYVVKDNSANVRPFYIDGMCVPDAGDVEDWLYFDGSTQGFVAGQVDFYWNGTPHGSTSTMRPNSRAGGRLYDLARYGFVLQMMTGLGMTTPNNIAVPLALPGGEQYERTLSPASDFSLVGYVQSNGADGVADLREKQRALKNLLDVRQQPKTQNLLLEYAPLSNCGEVDGPVSMVKCSFAGGLEGTWDSDYQENLQLRFRVHLPYIAVAGGTVGAALDVRDSFTAGYVARRSVEGIWGALNTSGLNGSADVILPMPDGRWLIGGNFINAGGVADADYLAYYDPTADTFAAANATPLNGFVGALLLLPTGNVLVGGNFVNAGGFANADYLCLLTVSTGAFSALNATPLSDAVAALALLPTGNVALGGSFLNAGGFANADYLALLTISTGAYSAFTSTPLNAPVNALTTTSWGALYIGGSFTDPGGFTANDFLTMLRYPAYSAFAQLTGFTVLSAQVTTVIQLSDGSMLIGGVFVNVNGDSTWDYLIRSIEAPGSGSTIPLIWSKPFSSINNSVVSVVETKPGTQVVGGDFSSVASVALFDGLFQYSGSTLIPLDLDLPGSPSVGGLGARPNGELIAGFTTTGTAYTSGTTTVTNTGSAPVKPVIVIKHPTTATLTAPLYSIRNLTTGKVISFNLTLLIGETLTIDLAANSITSDLRGNLISTVLPGSSVDSFYLVKGPNVINIFSSLASGSLPSAYIYWTPALAGVTDADAP